MPTSSRLSTAALSVFSAAAMLLGGPAAASARDYFVAPSGADDAQGTSSAPFRTIGQAAAVARSGETVHVASGRYRESVALSIKSRGVTFRGEGATKPIVDGAGTSSYGFRNTNASGLTISNFEITGQTTSGIYSAGSTGSTFSGNTIHHVGNSSVLQSTGIRVIQGDRNVVTANEIHHIGPGSESMGIWLVETRDATASSNIVYAVRKDGIRDWKGLDNTISHNRSMLNWTGVALNTSTGSTVTDNVLSDNTEGLNLKHVSFTSVLKLWNLDVGRWSKVSRNTVYRSTETSIWIGQSDEPLDYLDVRNNLFDGAGTAFVRDQPSLRGPHVTVDGNSYSVAGGKPDWIYKAGWSSDPGTSDWSVVNALGWELNPLSGASASNAGATDAATTDIGWSPYALTAIDSSSKGTFSTRNNLQRSADNDQNSYWLTAGNQDEWVIYDLGRERSINHAILTLFSHNDRRNPRGYRIETSRDGSNWTTASSGVNADPGGAAQPYEFFQTVTARYVRFTMIDTFCQSYDPLTGCGANFVLSDFKVGLLARTLESAHQSPSVAGSDTSANAPVDTNAPASANAPAGTGAGTNTSARPRPSTNSKAPGGAPAPARATTPQASPARPRLWARIGAGRRLVIGLACNASPRAATVVSMRLRGGRSLKPARASASGKPTCAKPVSIRLTAAAAGLARKQRAVLVDVSILGGRAPVLVRLRLGVKAH